MDRLLLELWRLLQPELSRYFPQQQLLPIAFRHFVEGHSSQILPKRQVEKRKPSLFSIHPDSSVVSSEISYPQSLHVENHLVLHLLVPCPFVSNSVSWVAWKYLVSPKSSQHYFGFRPRACQVQGGCDVEIHVGGFGVNTFHERLFNLFNVLEIFVEQNQVKTSTWVQGSQLLEWYFGRLPIWSIFPEGQVDKINLLFLGKSHIQQPGYQSWVDSSWEKYGYFCPFLVPVTTFYGSCQFPHTLDQQFFNSAYYFLDSFIDLLKSYFFQVNLMDFMIGPKCLTISEVDWYHRIAGHLK